MPRLKLRARESYPFRCELSVRIGDVNYGGHLGHDRLLSLMQEARLAFLAAHSWSEMNCAGSGLIMGDAVVVYQGEAFAGDVLRFELAAGEPGRFGFRFFYRVTRPADGRSIALAETGMICFDYERRTACPLPAALAEML